MAPHNQLQNIAPESVKTTVVAIDKDKNSQHALRWAIDHLVINNPVLTLVHVNEKPQYPFNREELFSPFRRYCNRKGVQTEEIVFEETDTARTLLDYIHSSMVSNIVLGASGRNAFARTFKQYDVPTNVLKSAPEFCSVYVISKGKVQHVRPGIRLAGNVAAPPRQSSLRGLRDHLQGAISHSKLEAVESLHRRHSSLNRIAMHEKMPEDNSKDILASPRRNRVRSAPTSLNVEIASPAISPPNNPGILSLDTPGIMSPTSTDGNSLMQDTPGSMDLQNHSKKELEAEMKRLKQELKQTMDMYSTACKEAISAKQKAKELKKWKMEEARKFEKARNAEEAALAMVEMEQAKCKAAIEAAEAAQRLAEMEAQKRRDAELKARQELEEKNRALTILAENDFRYRKYDIQEIEAATHKFSDSMRIGEGGYGPVFKGKIDHTPVAIKLLRPDAAQGRKQFQQEVEVLCSIRHPNMVLLLGACPEYGCLVYEYMENGSLEDRLLCRGNSPPLPWRMRIKIAAEITTALLFLHQTKPEPIVHRDLKPANILIDRNYVSKISDVGLARLVPPSVADSVTQYHMTSAAGTFCYIDPEYQQTGMLTTKSDVYSLGIMLLQIITAKPAMGIAHHVSNAISSGTFEGILDPAVTDWEVEEALIFAKLALQCAELRKRDRPDLGTVVVPELNRLRNIAYGCSSGSQSPGVKCEPGNEKEEE